MNENTVTVRNTAVSIGELPRRGIHCYMVYAVDVYDVATSKACLESPIAILVQKLEAEPTDNQCQEIISKHDHCPPEIAEVVGFNPGVLTGSLKQYRMACTFFCINCHGIITKQLHHACL